MTSDLKLSPFVAALGPLLDQAAPAVRRHLQSEERVVHAGELRRRWSHGPWGRLAALVLHLGGGEGAGERFELMNEVVGDVRGAAMLWERTHHRRSGTISGVGSLRWDPERGVLLDAIGRRKWLEVELAAGVEEGAVVLTSRRQWLRVAGIRLPLPRVIFGGARTREWEEPDGRLGLSLALRHPLFGAYAGYQAVFAREPEILAPSTARG